MKVYLPETGDRAGNGSFLKWRGFDSTPKLYVKSVI
jgi:hypothetical protein